MANYFLFSIVAHIVTICIIFGLGYWLGKNSYILSKVKAIIKK